MKHTFIVKESRQLESHERSMLHSFYPMGQIPHLFCLPDDCYHYTGWFRNEPVAAVNVDCTDFKAAHVIRLSDTTGKNRKMLSGLIDRVLFQLQSKVCHRTLVSLKLPSDAPDDLLNGVQDIGFLFHHEATPYEFLCVPYTKTTFEHWQFCIEYPETHHDWLRNRNQFFGLLPGATPFTDRKLDLLHRRQTIFYSLKWKGTVVGTMYGEIKQGRLYLHELHIVGPKEFTQEGISFFQQSYYDKFKKTELMSVTATSMQTHILHALYEQGARPTPSSTYTLLKYLTPSTTT
ncbi:MULTISPECIES: hypothetical protein [Exiguobacterium]|uniref:hypothetical protein n=1 Tax=Exiguobacterium TaxID=33986 RepID=UPI001BEB52DC|nr:MULTISPECIES: hypothetical protein [Exiguobacterium]MCT4776772.1 hypothetical protein [Exiguobacterium aquaticum]MCT4789222.1 hypothetical protein [Exiguobacterium mexicanum]